MLPDCKKNRNLLPAHHYSIQNKKIVNRPKGQLDGIEREKNQKNTGTTEGVGRNNFGTARDEPPVIFCNSCSPERASYE